MPNTYSKRGAIPGLYKHRARVLEEQIRRLEVAGYLIGRHGQKEDEADRADEAADPATV